MRIVIMGAGEHARVVLSILRYDKEITIEGLIDVCNNSQLWGTEIKGLKVLGGVEILSELYKKGITGTIIAFGDNKTREELTQPVKKIGFTLINAIHPSAMIDNEAVLGDGITICSNVTINTDAVIGNNAIINTGAIIEHDCQIGENSHIASGARLAGGVKVSKNAFVGIGATIIDNITIGENSIVGAGAVVIRHVPDNVTVVGMPAKILGK